jgi:hypothetical protein
LPDVRVGAIVDDARVLGRPDEVREAGRVLALAIDRGRLVATLRASRARIAAAGDEERRRIARDLHDGLRSRLVFLKIQAGMGTDGAELSAGIEGAIDDLRARRWRDARAADGPRPARGGHRPRRSSPGPVTVRVDGHDERLASAIESAAFFVVSEALVNAVKHAGADRLAVVLRAHRRRPPDRDRGRRRGAPRRRGDARDARPRRCRRRGAERRTPAGCGTSVRATIPVAAAKAAD